MKNHTNYYVSYCKDLLIRMSEDERSKGLRYDEMMEVAILCISNAKKFFDENGY